MNFQDINGPFPLSVCDKRSCSKSNGFCTHFCGSGGVTTEVNRNQIFSGNTPSSTNDSATANALANAQWKQSFTSLNEIRNFPLGRYACCAIHTTSAHVPMCTRLVYYLNEHLQSCCILSYGLLWHNVTCKL